MRLQLVHQLLSQDGSEKEKASKLLSEADQARDARKWSEAAELYAGYLKLRRADAPIWVQYGHALKSSGKLDEAEKAYSESLQIAPRYRGHPSPIGPFLQDRWKGRTSGAGLHSGLQDSSLREAR